MKQLMWLKSYRFMIIGILFSGLIVDNIISAIIFTFISIFTLTYGNKSLDETFFTSVIFIFTFLAFDFILPYIPFEFIAFNYSKGLVLLMLLLAIKCRFNFDIFMDHYQNLALRLIFIAFITLGLLMINYQYGVIAYLSAITCVLIHDLIFQKVNTKLSYTYDKIKV